MAMLTLSKSMNVRDFLLAVVCTRIIVCLLSACGRRSREGHESAISASAISAGGEGAGMKVRMSDLGRKTRARTHHDARTQERDAEQRRLTRSSHSMCDESGAKTGLKWLARKIRRDEDLFFQSAGVLITWLIARRRPRSSPSPPSTKPREYR